jgi:hypothetical protein
MRRTNVVSATLQKAEWNNSTLTNDNIAQEIAGLKQAPGKDVVKYENR